MLTQKVTTPAPKYGPTPVFGPCETPGCEATARRACAECSGHYCLRHAPHERHSATS